MRADSFFALFTCCWVLNAHALVAASNSKTSSSKTSDKPSLDIVTLAPKINSHQKLSIEFTQYRDTAVTRKRKLPTGQTDTRGVAFFQRDPERFKWQVLSPKASAKTISYNGKRLSVYSPAFNVEKTFSSTGSVGQEYQKIILMLRDPIQFLKEYTQTSSKRLSKNLVYFSFDNKIAISETKSVAITIDETVGIISKAELTYRGSSTGKNEDSGERILRFEFSNPKFSFEDSSLDPQIPKDAKPEPYD